MRSLGARIAIVFGTLALAVVIWQFRHAIFALLMAVALGASLRPLVDRLRSVGVPAPLSVAGFYGLIIVGALLLFAWLQTPLNRELTRLSNDIVFAYDRLIFLVGAGSETQSPFLTNLPDTREVADLIGDEPLLTATTGIVGLTSRGLSFLLAIGFTVVLSIYWIAEGPSIERWALSRLGVRRRRQAGSAWRMIESQVGGTIRHAALEALGALVILSLVYMALGLRFPLTLALAAAAASLFPWLGPVLQAVLLLLAGTLADFQLHVLAAVVSLLFYIGLHRFFTRGESGKFLPNPLLLILGLLLLTQVYGPIGIIFAAPLASLVQGGARSLLMIRSSTVSLEGEDLSLEEVSQRVSGLKQKLRDEGLDDHKPLVDLLRRLETAVGQIQSGTGGRE